MRDFPPKFLPPIIKAITRHNVLPLGSPCNLSCYFCSHRFNPPELRVLNIPFIPLDLIKELIPRINPREKIVLGESATRINEGEPFLHPDILGVIKALRELFPRTMIQITTNGTLLTPKIQDHLPTFNPIELVISFNSFKPEIREKFLGDHFPEKTLGNFSYLSKSGIKFQGSFLLSPPFFPELPESLARIEELGAYFVRLLLPGGARWAHPDLQMPLSHWFQLKEKVEGIRAGRNIPIVVEPPLISDLQARVEGVIHDSPAQRSGLKSGDIVEKVNGFKPRSRVEAFRLINDSQDPLILIKREKHLLEIQIKKKPKEKSGLVFLHDLDPDEFFKLSALIPGKGNGGCFTSELAFKMVSLFFLDHFTHVPVFKIPNFSFGGSIRVLGLIGVRDIRMVLKGLKDTGTKLDWAILNPIFLEDGLDLWGEEIQTLEEEFGLSLIFPC